MTDRYERIRAQRDELRDRLEAVLAAAPQQPAASSGAAAGAEPAVWVAADTLNSPHPACISSLAYMSQLDRERGREYVPLYTAPQQPAGVDGVCEWDIDEDIGLWGADCGVSWTFIEGGPAENKLRHCPNCGKPVALAAQQQGGAE